LGYLRQLEAELAKIGLGKVASVAGRFWAMDRDNRWERVQTAYEMLTGGKAPESDTAAAAVQAYYDKPSAPTMVGDEFVPATRVRGAGSIKDGDSVLFFNFRGDRPRELTRAFLDADFKGFPRARKLDLFYATLTNYEKGLCPNVVFDKPAKMENILGEWVAKQGLAQFRTAETEKFPHVTFFFNDYREEPFPGEERGMAQILDGFFDAFKAQSAETQQSDLQESERSYEDLLARKRDVRKPASSVVRPVKVAPKQKIGKPSTKIPSFRFTQRA
jgi:2,3-bisphosphoglycerate-independent phosphoglycerate mutase